MLNSLSEFLAKFTSRAWHAGSSAPIATAPNEEEASCRSMATMTQALFLANRAQVRSILGGLSKIEKSDWSIGDSHPIQANMNAILRKNRLFDDTGQALAAFTGYIHDDKDVITDYARLISPINVFRLMERLRKALGVENPNQPEIAECDDDLLSSLERAIPQLPFRKWDERGVHAPESGCFIAYNSNIGQVIVLCVTSSLRPEQRSAITGYLACVSPQNIMSIVRTIRALELRPELVLS